MKSLSWYLARHYLPINRQESSISLMATISFISICIGTFSLALVTAIMNGFQVTIEEKMRNIQPQATIYSYKQPIALSKITAFIGEKFHEIKAMSPYAIGHVMVQSDEVEEGDIPMIAALKAIDPLKEKHTTALINKIKDKKSLSIVEKNNVLMGVTLARNLNVVPGDNITLLYIEPPHEHAKKVSVHQKKATVGALFETGIEEYDNGTIYTSYDLFNELFPDQGITQIGLAFTPQSSPKEVAQSLKQALDMPVLTWQELYKPLLSAQIIEKYAMFLILLLITLVASMNIIALIFMIITHKRADIAILRAMGLPTVIIVRTFILLGMIISIIASCIGLALAWLASWCIETYPFIELPDVYYVSHLPARMEWSIIIAVFLIVLIVTYLASWFSARRIYSINIAHILRFEG